MLFLTDVSDYYVLVADGLFLFLFFIFILFYFIFAFFVSIASHQCYYSNFFLFICYLLYCILGMI